MSARVVGITLLLASAAICFATTLNSQSGGAWESGNHATLRSGSGSAPTGRYLATEVWTGTHMFVFGGQHHNGDRLNNGGLYDAVLDSWVPTPNLSAGLAQARKQAVGCWTGEHVIVWGGMDLSQAPALRSGFMYAPATDSFAVKPNLNGGVGAPTEAWGGIAVWTGEHMLVYGGNRQVLVSATFNSWWSAGVFDGGIYDPVTDTWLNRPALNAEVPAPQHQANAVWIGDGLYSRAGNGGAHPTLWGQSFTAGRLYRPDSDTWHAPQLLASGLHAPIGDNMNRLAIWTGEWVVEFGSGTVSSTGSTVWSNSGLRYSPNQDVFLLSPRLSGAINAPPERYEVPRVWTGSHLWVWGGQRHNSSYPSNAEYPLSGGLYDPVADLWSPTSLSGTPTPRTEYSAVWTGSSLLGYGGFLRLFPNAPLADGAIRVYHDTGFVYHPPRVAPTVRNLSAAPSAGKPLGDIGASAANPLRATYGVPFRHRIVCYGTPEAALISLDKPSWLQIGWGGPGPLVAAGTGQGNGGTGGAPPGTGAPFHPWFSANGGTADGQWLRGTPDAAATGLHSFTIHAHNGVFPDSATYTVWIDVAGPPVWDDNSIIAGPPEPIARSGVDYAYFPQTIANPAATYSVSGLPAWATWVGFGFHGTPTTADEYTVSHITVTATNPHGSISRNYYLTVLPAKPLAPGIADVNSDGDVNVLDVQRTINILLSLEPPSFIPHPTEPPPAQLQRGDIDASGVVDVVDIQALVNAILGR